MASVSSLRARRWDVLVLGGALPGLIAAVRLARSGQRVLVVEEDRAARTPALLREPFALPAPALLDPLLQALGLAMVERRGFTRSAIDHQVILPGARVDVGPAAATAHEWAVWDLAKPEEARALAEGLDEAARAEAEALLGGSLLRSPRRLALKRGGELQPEAPTLRPDASGRHMRGLPAEVGQVGEALAALFAAQVRSFGGLASATVSPEARARLIGGALVEGGALPRGDVSLCGLVRERLQALHAEFRTLGTPFEFVRVGDHPGITAAGPGDAWLGRVVLVNAPALKLAQALHEWQHPVPGFLAGPEPTHRRLSVHMRALTSVVPEALAARAILVDDPAEPAGPGTIALSHHPSPRGARYRELIGRVVVPDDPGCFDAAAERIENVLVGLMPFCEGRVARGPLAAVPLWDDDAVLADPSPGAGWPAEVAFKPAARDPIYVAPRHEVGALGVEGDVMLGWRMGDALAEVLA